MKCLGQLRWGPLGILRGEEIQNRKMANLHAFGQALGPLPTRQLVRNGAEVLICMANGMAFDQAAPLRQHFDIARFRAIENDRYFVRCGSHGVTCLVSPTGQLVGRAPCFDTAIANLSIPIYQSRPLTLFCRYGDWLTTACWVVLAGCLTACLVKRVS